MKVSFVFEVNKVQEMYRKVVFWRDLLFQRKTHMYLGIFTKVLTQFPQNLRKTQSLKLNLLISLFGITISTLF